MDRIIEYTITEQDLVPSGTINVPLSRKPGSIIVRIPDPEHGEKAVTHYRVVTEKNGYSLLSFTLETGRTHQIRIHMKTLGFPLTGDYLYNPEEAEGPLSPGIHRQALHAYRLSFTQPVTGQPLSFTAPLPRDMEELLR